MKSLIKLSFILSIIGSIISQLPEITHSNVGLFLKGFWLIPFILMLFYKPSDYFDKPLLSFLEVLLIFGSYCLVMDTFSSNNYLGRDLYNMMVSFSIFIISYKFWKRCGSEQQLKYINLALLISGVVFAFFIFRDYLDEYDFMLKLYAYKGKNATSVVVLCSSFIPLITLRLKNKWFYCPILFCIFFMLYVVFLMKSRATYVGVAFLIYYFIFKLRNKKIKVITLLLTITAIIWVLVSPNLYHIVVEGGIFASRDVEDINDLTSGRIYLISDCWELFKQNIWLGNGNLYMDCMPIVMLTQYGILGASIIFIFLFVMGRRITYFSNNNRISLIAFLLFAIFMLNSLFEAQPPFGPGVKCFLLWMFVGFSYAEIEIPHLANNKI